jgi:hypothetical protein
MCSRLSAHSRSRPFVIAKYSSSKALICACSSCVILAPSLFWSLKMEHHEKESAQEDSVLGPFSAGVNFKRAEVRLARDHWSAPHSVWACTPRAGAFDFSFVTAQAAARRRLVLAGRATALASSRIPTRMSPHLPISAPQSAQVTRLSSVE